MADARKELPKVTAANLRPPYPESGEKPVYRYFEDCARHAFRPDSKRFEMVNAWWLCEAATLVYWDPENISKIFRVKAGLADFTDLSRGSTECFAVRADGFAIIIFRGTEASPRAGRRFDFSEIFADLLTDFNALPVASELGGRVHRGFKAAVDQVWGEERGDGLQGFLSGLGSRKVWMTGHSLGAALATLAAAKCKREHNLHGLYTFGSPRVGDGDFVRAFERHLSQEFGIEYYRFVNNRDVVTIVPPHGIYRHAGLLKHIGPDGRISDGPSLLDRIKNGISSIFTMPFDATGRLNPRFVNLIPNALEDHVPTLYATHIWNAHVT